MNQHAASRAASRARAVSGASTRLARALVAMANAASPSGYPPLGDLDHVSLNCVTCCAYRLRRARVLPPALHAAAHRRGIRPSALFNTYMTGVHARHLAGLSLETEKR